MCALEDRPTLTGQDICHIIVDEVDQKGVVAALQQAPLVSAHLVSLIKRRGQHSKNGVDNGHEDLHQEWTDDLLQGSVQYKGRRSATHNVQGS